MILAVTGATGFVGGHLLDRALAEGYLVRALTRRTQPPREGVTWVEGALDRPDSLAALVSGAGAVIHIAGVVNAPDRAAFAQGNVEGTRAVFDAAEASGTPRFVHVSSLSAREPTLSDYGWSKAEAERLVAASPLACTIVRPPGIFGPRDTELLDLFRMARLRVMPLPPAGGRASWVYAPELVRLLIALATSDDSVGDTLEPDDGAPDGWDHRDFACAIGAAMGKRVLPLPLPRPLLRLGAAIDGAVRGKQAKLTPDRVRYLSHPDWVCGRPPPPALWRSETETPAALAETARWYRSRGLLQPAAATAPQSTAYQDRP